MTKASDTLNKMLSYVDPRYLVLFNHILLLAVGILFLDLRRSWEQIVLVIVVAIVVELILSKITFKQQKFDVWDRFLSSTVLALSTLLLIRSSFWWFYAFIAVIGVASKYILVNDKGRHLYNPTNVAIVFGLVALPEFINVRPDSFSTHIFPLCCILFFGTLAVLKANRWRVTLGYVGGIMLLGIPMAYIMDYPLLIVLGPEANVAVLLFAFLMITDPQTTPKDHHLQWIFGFLIAAINLWLRYEELYYSQFIALFIMLSFSIFLYHLPRHKAPPETPASG